jgi:hypothetical protein
MATRLTPREKAARKAARTRAANAAAWKRWKEVGEPTLIKIDLLVHRLIKQENGISLRWIGTRRLRKGAQYGRLVRTFHGGKLWRVLIEGYAHPQDFHPAFWEVLGE